MKVKLTKVKTAYISGDFIKLDALLKYLSLVGTGGEAKLVIKEGAVFVNGEPCIQRGRKIKPGDIIRFDGKIYAVAARSV